MIQSENSTEQKRRAAPRTAFKPGVSGNPGGRPALVKSVQEAARTHTVGAIETLAHIMEDARQPGATRVAAANALLDRAWGKSPAAVEVGGGLTLEALVLAITEQSATI